MVHYIAYMPFSSCYLRVVEHVAPSIYFDHDELSRLDDFIYTSHGVMDIEIPMELRKSEMAEYLIRIEPHENFVSTVKAVNKTTVEMKWTFPIHVAYHLEYKDEY
jgi:hypothetical protein